MADGGSEARLPIGTMRHFAALRRMFRNRLFAAGVLILLPLAVMAAGVSALGVHDPMAINTANKLQPPSLSHPFGTDEFGRDLFARVLHGSQISLRVAAAATVVMALLGIVLGCVAGFYRAADAVISRIGDALLNFPGLIIGIMVMAALGQSERNVVLSMVIMYTPRIVRVVRASVIEVKTIDFVDSARVAGAGDFRILASDILPHTIAPLVVQITFGFAWAILVESGLSFLGLGTPPPAPSWGNIISDGREFIRTAPWIMIFPGLMISLAVMGLNLIGDGLRDILDPRLRNAARRIETSVG
ncbi:MAG: ABC transporter permease [Alphaproteobacteria bacterium]|nr:ABC transporter permease [Alphaproteobacteria bacterium]